jgi:hypothetical protein
MAEQIPADDYKKLFVLDVRDAGQFAKDHVPGAVNIEWRKVFAERGKLPKDKTILVYCKRSIRGQVAIVGAGRSDVGRVPDKSVMALASQAAKAALADAGSSARRSTGC